jgi:Ser/Thr protein kinase RdoA (MazF antagonist)
VLLSDAEVAELRAIGDNSGSMALKGATPDHEGEPRPDRWSMDGSLEQVAERWSIDPERDLRQATARI